MLSMTFDRKMIKRDAAGCAKIFGLGSVLKSHSTTSAQPERVKSSHLYCKQNVSSISLSILGISHHPIFAFCASLSQHGRVWHKLLLANAMLCWLLRNTTNRPAAPTMSSNLILTLLEHSIVVAMTDYFEPNYPRCWMWLAITFAPAALLSCLVSQPTPKGSQQDPFIEVLASLFHVFTLAGL
jgi:hypothetical protein